MENVLKNTHSHIIGYYCNEYGTEYCTVYNSETLSEKEMQDIHSEYLKKGDVWSQCSFMSLSKAVKLKYFETGFDLLEKYC